MLTKFDRENLEGILHGEGSYFTAHLLRLIAKADLRNRHLLGEVYPDEVALVNDYQGVTPKSVLNP